MPRRRKLTEHDVAKIVFWWKRWSKIPTRKQMAVRFGVSEVTIDRIGRNLGYPKQSRRMDIEEVLRRIDEKRTVSRETDKSHQFGEAG